MRDVENTVRAKARELKDAILAAKAAGMRVTWPASADGLDGIIVNATARVAQAPPPQESPPKPQPVKPKHKPTEKYSITF